MERIADVLGLTREVVAQRLENLGLTPARRAALAEAGEQVDLGADIFIEKLYSRLQLNPLTAAWFRRRETIDRLKAHQRQYLRELVQAPINRTYVLRRLEIGVVHHRVRLTPRWYVATCAHFFCGQAEAVYRSTPQHAEGVERMATLLMTILFDAALSLDAYGMSFESALSAGEPMETENAPPPPAAPKAAPSSGSPPPPLSFSALPLSEDDCEQRRQFLDLHEATCATLRELEPQLHEALPRIIDEFYVMLRGWPEVSAILDDSKVLRLRDQVRGYWGELVQSTFDRRYAASRTRIGIIHEQIGVSVQMYLIGLARQVAEILRTAVAAHPQPVLAAQCLARAVFFDVSFVMDAYLNARAATVLRTEGVASQLLSSLPVGVAILNDQFRVRSVNPALLRLLNVEAEVVRHMHAVDLVTDTRIGRGLDRVAKGLEAREELDFSFGGRSLRVSVARLNNGPSVRPTRQYVIMVSDMTNLTRLAPSLDDNHRMLVETLGAIPAVIWEAEYGTWIMQAVSAPVVELTGFRPEHFLGRTDALLDLIPEPDRTRLREAVTEMPEGGRVEMRHRLISPERGVRWVRTLLVRGRRGSGDGVLRGISLDITAQHESDVHRQEAVTRLAGAIAHEFNGILSIVSGNLWLAAPSGVEPYAQRISAAVERGACFTHQLQRFARGMPVIPRPVALETVIAQLVPEIRRGIGDKAQLRVEGDGSGWRCEVDVAGFADALRRLVANAVEAMPQGGLVRISSRGVPARLLEPRQEIARYGDHIEVEIADTGCGMSSEQLAKALDPFYTTKKSAAGLGLSVVHGFVNQSQGHLLVDSCPLMGTVVRMRFPRHVESVQSRPATQAMRIVLVDDDDLVSQTMAELLRALGYRVEVYRMPDDALGKILTSPPDLVISDVMFDGSPLGAALGRKIAAEQPNLPFIYTSGYSSESLHLAPGDIFLPKPCGLDELKSAIARALHRAARAGPS